MIQKVKGSYDLFGKNSRNFVSLIKFLEKIFSEYNYKFIRTPNFEYSEVFHRENEFSDMVIKETYNFKDQGNRNLTLKPEGTAGVARAYIENKLYGDDTLHKFYYIAPNYRYERPQKGRYREFFQFGVEALGSKNASLDAEVVYLAYDIIKRLKLGDVVIKVNSLGDNESKKNYEKALKKYLKPNINKLCPDCQKRMDKNPLRILDCKIDKDNPILKNAPHSLDYLSKESKQYFNEFTKILKKLKVNYEIDHKLVRGLDYYTDIVFEIEAKIKGFGNANTIGAGGRYDNLISDLGGPKTPAIGFSFGLERLLMALDELNIDIDRQTNLTCYIIALNEKERLYGLEILKLLRENGFYSDLTYMNRSFKSNLKKALKEEPKYLIFLGDNELKNKNVSIKNTKTQKQESIKLNELINFLKEK